MSSQQENDDKINDETLILTNVKEYFDLHKKLNFKML